MEKTIIKRQVKRKKLLLDLLKKTPIIQFACEKSGISRATYYRWRQEDKEFVELSNQALSEGILLINDMAEAQLISLIKEKNVAALFFWLKHHHYTYSPKIEISTNTNSISEEELGHLTDLLYDQDKFKDAQKLLIYYTTTGKIDGKIAQLILKLFSTQIRVEDVMTRKTEANIMNEVMLRDSKNKSIIKTHHGH